MSGLSTNIFEALQKKKSSKKVTTEAVKEEPKVDKHAEIEKAIFSAPAAAMSNWADDSEEEWDAPVHIAAAEEGWNQVSYRIIVLGVVTTTHIAIHIANGVAVSHLTSIFHIFRLQKD